MSEYSKPIIKDYSGEDFTRLTFSLDLKRFKMEKLDQDFVDLMTRRAYDLAGTLKEVDIFLNGKRIRVDNFKKYCKLYTGESLKIAFSRCCPNWEVGLALSNTGYQQVSFVNSIATKRGGSHVEYVTKLIVDELSDLIKKRKKERFLPITDDRIKESMWLFVNCSIDNPRFRSSTKEELISEVENFGSKFEISKKLKDSMLKTGIIESVISDIMREFNLFIPRPANLRLREPQIEFKRRKISLDADSDEASTCESESEDDEDGPVT